MLFSAKNYISTVKSEVIKLKLPNLLTEVTRSPDASLSGSSAPLAQLTYTTVIQKKK